ncbi:Protein CBG16924 [Caenorhabditis briggsae]|uniref:Protein CBG16924 n=2 Tax=Caenorhabditis briggsae TaxID=6238 RepID=A8XQ24_CAEBR|nr:Protein CBG16924 [Caenorhabditis briggsae]ULT83421.1 hypothetical protein L3Y34_012569 [Caenorhabditis briggsae]CAP34750.1 Protein CBG16924 [Caenorhabditis briggsae]
MQHITYILIVFFFAGVTMASQAWKNGQYEDVGNGDDLVNFDRYITHKRAINGQLRRSSIRWGKRSGLRNFERDIPLVPDEYLVMWPAPEKQVGFETTTASSSSTQTPEQDEFESNENEEVFSKDNRRMERVAKAGIRPKLALSSRLWGR